MMFSIFANKLPSGRVKVTQVVPNVVVPEESRESIFVNAVKATAVADLMVQIKYNLDCIVYGKDCVDQTSEAYKLHMSPNNMSSSDVKEKYPLAVYESFKGFWIGERHSRLAQVLAENWVNENYDKVAK